MGVRPSQGRDFGLSCRSSRAAARADVPVGVSWGLRTALRSTSGRSTVKRAPSSGSSFAQKYCSHKVRGYVGSDGIARHRHIFNLTVLK